MNILMLTNVYTPQVGGVTRSIQQFTEEFRAQGHRVLVVAPEYEQTPDDETDVLRVSAIPNFYLDTYSLPLPIMPGLKSGVREFQPHIVHAHHPFLLGNTAHYIASTHQIPLVYTHHTRYSTYIETKTDWPPPVEQAVIDLIIGFCNLSDTVIAPSQGIEELLRQSGVTVPIEVIPTGVDLQQSAQGDGRRFREQHGLSPDAFVVGHVGRLSPEKNCPFLVKVVQQFLARQPDAVFLVVGDGPERESLENKLNEAGLAEQVIFSGFLAGQSLADAYCAMDLFAFSSQSETQGMVLAEAMAASVPVVALEATGVRDIVADGRNGFLIPGQDSQAFVEALQTIHDQSPDERLRMRQQALETAREVSLPRCADQMLALYSKLIEVQKPRESTEWLHLQQRWEAAWEQWKTSGRAVTSAVREALFPHANSE